MADLSITAAGFIPSTNASIIQGVAGENMTRGQAVYYDSGTATYKLFSANNVSRDALAGLSCADVATNQPVLILQKDPALALGATLANGDVIYGSANNGALTKTFADISTGWRVWVIGPANATNQMNFSAVKGGIK